MNIFIPIFINISTFIYSESSQQYFPFQSDIKIIVRIYYSLIQQWEIWLLLLVIDFLFISEHICNHSPIYATTLSPERTPSSLLLAGLTHQEHGLILLLGLRLPTSGHPSSSCSCPTARPAYIDSPHAKNSALHCSDWREGKRERRMRKNPLPSIFKILYMLRILFYLWYILQIFSGVSVVYLNLLYLLKKTCLYLLEIHSKMFTDGICLGLASKYEAGKWVVIQKKQH